MNMLIELIAQPLLLSVSGAITCLCVLTIGLIANWTSTFATKKWRERALKTMLIVGVVIGVFVALEATGPKSPEVKAATLHYIRIVSR